MRISRIDQYANIAKIISMRGSCERLQVGCVILKDNRIIATGYNGPLKGEKECSEVCDVSKPCQRAVHAEQNAICFAAHQGISLEGSTLITTHSPCAHCAALIIQAGINKVYFIEEFRSTEGLELLEKHQIPCTHLKVFVNLIKKK